MTVLFKQHAVDDCSVSPVTDDHCSVSSVTVDDCSA